MIINGAYTPCEGVKPTPRRFRFEYHGNGRIALRFNDAWLSVRAQALIFACGWTVLTAAVGTYFVLTDTYTRWEIVAYLCLVNPVRRLLVHLSKIAKTDQEVMEELCQQ